MGWVPGHAAEGVNPLNWPPAFFSWFAAGMLLAEWVHSGVGFPHRIARHRLVMAVVAAAAYLVAARRWPGRRVWCPARPRSSR